MEAVQVAEGGSIGGGVEAAQVAEEGSIGGSVYLNPSVDETPRTSRIGSIQSSLPKEADIHKLQRELVLEVEWRQHKW